MLNLVPTTLLYIPYEQCDFDLNFVSEGGVTQIQKCRSVKYLSDEFRLRQSSIVPLHNSFKNVGNGRCTTLFAQYCRVIANQAFVLLECNRSINVTDASLHPKSLECELRKVRE